MPKQGQKTITVRKDTYQLAEKKARKQKKSVAEFVTGLILESAPTITTNPITPNTKEAAR